MIHYNRTHTDQNIVVQMAAMDYCIVTDTAIVADRSFSFLVGTVDNDPVLDVYFITDPDTVNVATDHSVEPDTALISHNYVTYNG